MFHTSLKYSTVLNIKQMDGLKLLQGYQSVFLFMLQFEKIAPIAAESWQCQTTKISKHIYSIITCRRKNIGHFPFSSNWLVSVASIFQLPSEESLVLLAFWENLYWGPISSKFNGQYSNQRLSVVVAQHNIRYSWWLTCCIAGPIPGLCILE